MRYHNAVNDNVTRSEDYYFTSIGAMKYMKGLSDQLFTKRPAFKRVLSLVLSAVFVTGMMLFPMKTNAAESKAYWWEKTYDGSSGKWRSSDSGLTDTLPAVLGEGDDVVSLYFNAASTDELNVQLGKISGIMPIYRMQFTGSGEYVIGSEKDPLSVNQIYINENNTGKVEIFGDVESIYIESEQVELVIHGNAGTVRLAPFYINIGGNIEIDGNLENLIVYLKGKSVPEERKGYYNGDITVKGKVEKTSVNWLTGADTKVLSQQFGSTSKTLKLRNGSFLKEDMVPEMYIDPDSIENNVIYSTDGTIKHFSDIKNQYVVADISHLLYSGGYGDRSLDAESMGVNNNKEIREISAIRSNYGVDIGGVIFIPSGTAEDTKLTEEEVASLQSAFPGMLLSYYNLCAEKGNFLFSSADVLVNYDGIHSGFADKISIYDNSGKRIYSSDDGNYYYGMLSQEVFDVYGKSGSEIAVDYHTPEEIKAFMEAHPVQGLGPDYDVTPLLTSPYAPGELKSSVLNDALNMLNQIRYIAGLSHNVTLEGEYTELAQAGAMLDAVDGVLSHFPANPGDMSEELYKLGSTGASSSNLGWNYGTLSGVIKSGWLNDSDYSNKDRVGHRRWLLNPSMGKTGFGQAGDYTAMYCFDQTGTPRGTVSAWPAQNTPVNLVFGNNYAWSYSSGNLEEGDIHVTLSKESTGETWNFDKNHADGYFNVDNGGYGLEGCVIFAPSNLKAAAGDRYEVSITGLTGGDVLYHVYFFDLDSVNAAKLDDDFDPTAGDYTGWFSQGGKAYWYEGGVRQGNLADGKCFSYEGTVRGREIYDPASDGWYWLDVNADGAKACNKEVFMPYIYQDEEGHLSEDEWIEEVAGLSNRTEPQNVDLSAQIAGAIRSHGGEGAGKWVRYDAQGKMIKGWYTVQGSDVSLYPEQAGNTYYYDMQTGLMAKGRVMIDGTEHCFDEVTGVMQW